MRWDHRSVRHSVRRRDYRQDVADERVRVSSGSPYEASVGFSRGVRAGNHVAIAGTAPIWPDGSVDRDPLTQARRCWEIALGALANVGGRPEDVVRTRSYLVRRDVEAAASQAHGEIFADIRPASTMILVAGLLDPRWLVEVELDAILDGSTADPSGSSVGDEGSS